jgi:hypothetical protein
MRNVERKNNLLRRLRSREITFEEFRQGCAEWVVEEVESYSYTPRPIKPKEVVDFERIPETTRDNIDVQYYYDHPQILNYYNLVQLVKYENRYLYEWLKENLQYTTTEEGKGKILMKMGEWKGGE